MRTRQPGATAAPQAFSLLSQVCNDARSTYLEPETQRRESAGAQRCVRTPSIDAHGVEHTEPAASRAHQLATNGTRRSRRLVVLVDGRVTHVRGELALVHPVLVEQL